MIGSILSIQFCMKHKLLYSMLMLVFSSAGIADSRIPKPELLEYRDAIMWHRQEVYLAGFRIVQGQPDYFPVLRSLPYKIANLVMHTFFSGHDVPKTMSLKQLQELGYTESEPILNRLHEQYKIRLGPNHPLVTTLNQIEGKYQEINMGPVMALIDPALHEAVWNELKLAERSGDIVHTKIFRGEELDFVPEPYGAEKFLREHGEWKAAKLARWYETKYFRGKTEVRTVGKSCRSAHR